MRSHLLAKFARDGERKASGLAPKIFVFGPGKLWRAPQREAVPVAIALGVGLLLAGEGRVAADTPAPPPGMVPYTHPVYHNGVRVLWHGVWRGSQGKIARQTAQPAPAAAPTPAPQPPNLEGIFDTCGPR